MMAVNVPISCVFRHLSPKAEIQAFKESSTVCRVQTPVDYMEDERRRMESLQGDCESLPRASLPSCAK